MLLLGIGAATLAAVLVGAPWLDARARIVSRLPTTERVVALTFDDGPDPRYTPAVLEVLRDEGVAATFFVTGARVAACAGAVDYRGHLVGFHTYSHRDGRGSRARAQIADFERGEEAVPATWPTHPRCYRSPFGHVRPATVRWADRRGVYLGWSVCYDALIRDSAPKGGVLPHRERVAALVSRVSPGDIILLHDGNANGRYLVEDLPAIIRELKRRGYRFATPADFPELR
ncbi:MAG: polysaccharide deacetylase family protein [Coriobacteriia bacterium]|nr:polysaccharide deacetylase family protein [Coriobacteriia bacterium]